MEQSPKRHYESPVRREQADATRRRLAASARRLFAEHGYPATTIAAIAREAGIAVQTFYATYGSKQAMLVALIDEMEAEADLPDHIAALRATSEPRQLLRLTVEFNVRLFERGGDIMEILRGAAKAKPELAAVWREGEERRRASQRPLVHAWAEAGALRSSVSEDRARDILWALTGPDAYRLFVTESGWSAACYQAWLLDTLESLLFSL